MAVTVPRFDVATYLSQAALDTTHIDAIVAAFDRTGVVSGCGVTAGGASMVLTVAAGTVEIAGKTISVAGGTVTAVADGTNPRRSLVSVNSSGTLAITSGTPLAAGTGDPAIPAIPANSCPLAVAYIPAGATTLGSTNLTDLHVTLRQNFDAITYYADDYANIETCVAAANAAVTAGATGATVICGAKTYLTNGIDIGSHVSIIGQGKGNTRIQLNNAQNRAVIRGVNFLTLTGTAKQQPELRGDNNIELSGLTIDGNKANQTTGGIGIQLWGKLYRFSDVVVTSCFSHGIWTEYTDQYDIINHPERELMESVYDTIMLINNGGNGWDYHGPHDSYLNNAVMYANGGWAINIENIGDDIAGISMFYVNSYLNGTPTSGTGSFRVRGDLQTAVGCVASAGYYGTGWDIGSTQGDIKFVGCNTSGHTVGVLMRGSNHFYQGVIQLAVDVTGTVMGAGLVLNGASNCVVDATGAGNDYCVRITSDTGGNDIRGRFSVPSGKALIGPPASPLNAALMDPASSAGGSSNYDVYGTGSTNVWFQQLPQGIFQTQGPLRINGTGGILSTNPTIENTFGSPEGAVTANQGSIAVDSTLGALWQKRSGSGNTGWKRVVSEDFATINDAQFTLVDNGDATKKLQFQLAALTTATTRTLTPPDSDVYLMGVIAATQTADYTGTNVNTAQKVFNASTNGAVTLLAATSYLMEGVYRISTTGATSHTLGILFGGTATLTSIGYELTWANATTEVTAASNSFWVTAATVQNTYTAAAAASFTKILIKGIVRINAAGTFIPQYQWSAAPGTAGITAANSYLTLTPIGTNTVATIGNWS